MPAMKDVSAEAEPAVEVHFEDLAALEQEFDDAELEIIRKQHELNAPLYARRDAIVKNIPHFWALVVEQVPPELDQYIQPSDSQIFADALKSISVDRFEINEPNGSPRSFSIRMEFEPNDHFEDTVLEKKFWYRRAKDNWTGLVSEPVAIQWKKGKDTTKDLVSSTVKFWEARSKEPEKKIEELPAYQSLKDKLNTNDSDAMSFFCWFAWVSGRSWVSAEESAQANQAELERRQKAKAGQKLPEEQQEEDEVEYDEVYEIHPGGEDIAVFIAEDLFPNAIKYFTAMAEADDEDLSEMDEDFEELDEDDEGSDEEVDIRALVGKGKKSGSPPSKKQRT